MYICIYIDFSINICIIPASCIIIIIIIIIIVIATPRLRARRRRRHPAVRGLRAQADNNNDDNSGVQGCGV